MRALGFGHFAFCVGVAAVLLAGCGGSQPPVGAPGTMPQVSAFERSSTDYRVLYSFGGGSDGADPVAALIDVGGTLYGTTAAGGSDACHDYYDSIYSSCGTVFSITPSGTENVLHIFGGYPNDGANPYAPLIDVKGTLYGTTGYGGGPVGCPYYSCGTVFSITTSGTEKVLHSFSGYPNDGANPYAPLIDVKGTLYGTTGYGGGRVGCDYYSSFVDCGTVFSTTPTGTEKVLHTFSGYRTDGAFPVAELIDVKDMLFGTTSNGGKYGYGTVFSITTGGTEKVLHSFGTGSDGRAPIDGLIELKGKLYGTTRAGGDHSCGSGRGQYAGCGTVFSITPDGVEKVLHSFNSTDGANPAAALIDAGDTFYGTTAHGGANGDGTVFSITLGGTEKVLHSFTGYPNDGVTPKAPLIDVGGTLYGTTSNGGADDDGTVFALKE
jgi:uncharacterized repeat protein (TIGR03803 family)